MTKSLPYVVAVVLIGGGCWLTHAWGQETTDPTSPTPIAKVAVPQVAPDALAPTVKEDSSIQPDDSAPAGPMEAPRRRVERERFARDRGGFIARVQPDGGGRFFGGPMTEGERARWFAERRAFQEAVEKLRAAKEGPEKEAAKKELAKLLDRSFTHDLERREHEVTEIESRVKKLRDQIDKRKNAKDEIIGLRLKTIINESEGLGFPGPVGFEHRPVTQFGAGEIEMHYFDRPGQPDRAAPRSIDGDNFQPGSRALPAEGQSIGVPAHQDVSVQPPAR
jgi:hypothetical protein